MRHLFKSRTINLETNKNELIVEYSPSVAFLKNKTEKKNEMEPEPIMKLMLDIVYCYEIKLFSYLSNLSCDI